MSLDLDKLNIEEKLKDEVESLVSVAIKDSDDFIKKQGTKFNDIKKGSAGHRRCNCCGTYSPLGETILKKYKTQKRYRICIKCAGDFLL